MPFCDTSIELHTCEQLYTQSKKDFSNSIILLFFVCLHIRVDDKCTENTNPVFQFKLSMNIFGAFLDQSYPFCELFDLQKENLVP